MIALFGGEDIGKNIYTEKFENIKLKKFNSIVAKKYILHRQDLKINLMSNTFEAFRFDFVNKNKFPSENKKIEIRGFGSFRIKKSNARKARNPKTGEKLKTPEKRKIRFKMCKKLFKKINNNE